MTIFRLLQINSIAAQECKWRTQSPQGEEVLWPSVMRHKRTTAESFQAQLGQRDQKKLICMLLSLQAALLDKVTGVGLPMCWPHAANRSNALQPFRRAQATAVFLIIGTIMASDSRQRWSTTWQRGVAEVTSTQPAHAADAVWTSKPFADFMPAMWLRGLKKWTSLILFPLKKKENMKFTSIYYLLYSSETPWYTRYVTARAFTPDTTSALIVSRYRYQSDIRTLQMIHIYSLLIL